MLAYLSVSIPILALAAALQSSLVPQIRILGGGPDFVLLLVMSWSVNSEFDEALTWAFVGGIVQDLLSAAPTGTSSLGLILIVTVVQILDRRLYRVGFLLLSLLVVAGTLLKETVFALVMSFVGFPADFLNALSYAIVPSALYNVALLAPAYWFVRRVQKRVQPAPRVFQ